MCTQKNHAHIFIDPYIDRKLMHLHIHVRPYTSAHTRACMYDPKSDHYLGVQYGNVLEDYSSIPLACYTLFRMMLGDFDFDPLRKENKLLGPLYFVMYTLLSSLLLLNMFVAIVMEGYDEVRSNEEKVTILQFVRKAFGMKAQMEGKCPPYRCI